MKQDETTDLIKLYVTEKQNVMQNFPIGPITQAVELVWNAYLNGGTIYACGNGGNASYVGNLVCDLSMHPFVSDDKSKAMPHNVKRLRTTDLTATTTNLTGILNDLGPDKIFSQQLINDGIKKYDVLFGFTGSGNSPNILEAFNIAKEYGAKTIAITRGTGGKIKDISSLCIIIPGTSTFPGQIASNDNNFHYEDSLSIITHMITGIMRKRVTELYDQ
jgi:D-sedoheptulose 7-phosphate isomerase